MFVTAVIVTYGDRYHFLEKVVESLVKEQIDKIIVVLNGVAINSRDQIENLASGTPILKLLDLKKNTGSAGGFKHGIKESLKLQSEYIWLLDDDNCPQLGALINLKKSIKNNFSNKKDALLSYRMDRPLYLNSVKKGNGSGMLKGPNSALGFSLFQNQDDYSDYERDGLKVAPYGGLFFHKDIIDIIGLPDESYFLYGDDFDFTIRISKRGGKIWFVENSTLFDLEKSFHIRSKKVYQTRFHLTENVQLIQYSVRNGIVFELEHQVKLLALYFINLFIYSLLVTFLLIISFDFKKAKFFLKGVFQGIQKGLKLRR